MTGFSCAWRGFHLLGSSSSRSTRKHAFASPCPQHAPTFETVQDPDDDWAPTFLTLFALLTVYCPDINEQKAIEQVGSTRRGKHLLMRGKVLYHVLIFEAERARYEGRLGHAEEILIGLKTLSEALADRDDLFCVRRGQQAHLAPATDVDGWESVTAVLRLTGDLPFPKAQQQDYLGSLANIIMLGYRSR